MQANRFNTPDFKIEGFQSRKKFGKPVIDNNYSDIKVADFNGLLKQCPPADPPKKINKVTLLNLNDL
jgi:hypothetical protein